MKASKIGTALLIVFFLGLCSPAYSQQHDSNDIPLAALKSPDWGQRASAYGKIKHDQEALKRANVKRALLELQDRENHVNRSMSEKYGEGYSEYLGELGDTINQLADWHDSQDLCILAQSIYNPESAWATKLAVEGGTSAVPCLLKMAGSDDVWDRYESIPVLEHLAALPRVLPPAILQQIQQTVFRGLQDPNVSVRQGTIKSVGEFGKPEMIPVLENLARFDPASRPDNGKQVFYVREAAARAIKSIRERGGHASNP
jgi:hypothetical protein